MIRKAAFRAESSWCRGTSAFLLILVLGLSPVFSQNQTEDPAPKPRLILPDDIFERHENAAGEVIFVGDNLRLKENDKLLIEEDARIYLDRIDLDEGSKIDASGQDLELYVEEEVSGDLGVFDISADLDIDTSGNNGENGDDGVKALDGLKGSSGAHGSDATDGTNGADADQILVITPRIKGDVILMARGGDGGRGGLGGDGGRGGAGLSGEDARVLFRFDALNNTGVDGLLDLGATIGIPYVGQVLAVLKIFNGITIGDGFDGYDGGDGGDAGHGGHGGDGGKGGKIELIFASKDEGSRIYVSTRGGRGGPGGAAGAPGVAGPGGKGGEAGDIWARDGRSGDPGQTGAKAESGSAGQSGQSGSVKVIETGDEEWLKCYIRYRQSIDLGVPSDLAYDILRHCAL